MTNVVAERDAARADLCRLLAACYYEPGPELAEEGVFPAISAAAARIDDALAGAADAVAAAYAADPSQTLLIDYARLFLGPPQALAKPYGSAWLEVDSGLMQDSTIAATDLYAEGGFELADDFLDLPDHVAAELEFLYLLLFRGLQAAAGGDSASAADLATLRRRFLDEHLGKWIAPFAEAMRGGAETAFYRELATLTERFVAIETRLARD